jgi:hypothetical protein
MVTRMARRSVSEEGRACGARSSQRGRAGCSDVQGRAETCRDVQGRAGACRGVLSWVKSGGMHGRARAGRDAQGRAAIRNAGMPGSCAVWGRNTGEQGHAGTCRGGAEDAQGTCRGRFKGTCRGRAGDVQGTCVTCLERRGLPVGLELRLPRRRGHVAYSYGSRDDAVTAGSLDDLLAAAAAEQGVIRLWSNSCVRRLWSNSRVRCSVPVCSR